MIGAEMIFTVHVEIEVEADDVDQAWQAVAEPFHNNVQEVSKLIPAMTNWYIEEANPEYDRIGFN